jgi:hypothetical protein
LFFMNFLLKFLFKFNEMKYEISGWKNLKYFCEIFHGKSCKRKFNPLLKSNSFEILKNFK